MSQEAQISIEMARATDSQFFNRTSSKHEIYQNGDFPRFINEENEPRRKRLKASKELDDFLADDEPEYPCPYIVRYPETYYCRKSCRRKWPASRIHGIKEHLKDPRHGHFILICLRCYKQFEEKSQLVAHRKSPLCSPAGPRNHEQGFDEDQRAAISKKFRGLAASEYWKRLYQTLFPDVPLEEVPMEFDDVELSIQTFESFSREQRSQDSELRKDIMRIIQKGGDESECFGEIMKVIDDRQRVLCNKYLDKCRRQRPRQRSKKLTQSHSNTPAGLIGLQSTNKICVNDNLATTDVSSKSKSKSNTVQMPSSPFLSSGGEPIEYDDWQYDHSQVFEQSLSRFPTMASMLPTNSHLASGSQWMELTPTPLDMPYRWRNQNASEQSPSSFPNMTSMLSTQAHSSSGFGWVQLTPPSPPDLRNGWRNQEASEQSCPNPSPTSNVSVHDLNPLHSSYSSQHGSTTSPSGLLEHVVSDFWSEQAKDRIGPSIGSDMTQFGYQTINLELWPRNGPRSSFGL